MVWVGHWNAPMHHANEMDALSSPHMQVPVGTWMSIRAARHSWVRLRKTMGLPRQALMMLLMPVMPATGLATLALASSVSKSAQCGGACFLRFSARACPGME
eukprot:6484696-Amphidinium_carterae.1